MNTWWLRVVLATAAFGLVAPALAQRFEWRNVVQDVEIFADGTVVVDDERTLWTSGDFGEAFICIPLAGGQRIELLEGSGAVSPGPPATAFSQSCDGGTELVVRNQQRLSERRVRFRYRMSGTVEAFSDVVQWYWNMVRFDHPVILGYSLTVRAPGTMAEPFDAYVHRYSNPELPRVALSAGRDVLTVAFERIPDGDGVEIRYLMDPALFTVRGNQPAFERLLRDEAEIAGLLERNRRLEQIRRHPAWGLLGLALLGWLAWGIWKAYQRSGREPDIPSMMYPFEPPSDIPPAAVTDIQRQSPSGAVMGPGFHATIMDLARRGYGEFTGKGRQFEMVLDLEKPTDRLEDFERSVLDYLKKAARSSKRGDPAHLEFKELKAYSQKNAGTFLQSWGRMPRRWLEARFGGPLLSQESQRNARRWGGLSLLATAILGLAAFLTQGPARIEFIVLTVLSFILMVAAGTALQAWREEVAREVYGWKGFKRTLTDYTRMKDAPDDFFKLWDRYFVYAAALGVAQQFLANLRRAAPLRGIDERTLVRQGSWMGSSSATDLASMSSSISSLSSALASASASASSGGSSSGGGGGGGGGGSSGGR